MPHTQPGSSGDVQLGVVCDSSGRPRYVLQQLLDEGGSEGRIFLAADVETHDPVALKQFTCGLGPGISGRDLGGRLRTLRAASLQLRHVPGLVGYLDPFEGGVPGTDWARTGWWLPMEYVPGESLAAILARGVDAAERRTLLEALGSVATTLEQLAGLRPPVAHRDVKPANIMVRTTSSGSLECVLVDIGLLSRGDRQHFSVVGSNGYIAPELSDARPVPRHELHLADWYSFTAMLYAVVTGQAPPSAPERWPAALQGVDIAARHAAALISAGQAPPAARPRPTELLEELLADEPAPAVPSKPRRRGMALVGLAVVAALVVAGVWAYGTGLIAGGSAPSADPVEPIAASTAQPAAATSTATEPARAELPAGQHRIGVSDWVLCYTVGARVKCSGDNQAGSLGEGTTVDRPGLVAPLDLDSVIAIDVGFELVCAIAEDTTLWCWGGGTRVGLPWSARPIRVPGLTAVSAVAVNETGVCAVSEGVPWCWGVNSWGQLGDGQASDRAVIVPVRVEGITEVVAVVPYCVLRANGEVLCWRPTGGHEEMKPQLPAVVRGLPPVTGIAGTDSVTCAVAGGDVYCWGSDDELWDSPLYNGLVPERVAGLDDVVSIAVGDFHACALRNEGSIWCWGDNFNGALGNGTVTDSAQPIRVDAGFVADEVAAGGSITCALRDDDVWCWGENLSAQFADGTTAPALRPVPVGVRERNERAVSLAAVDSTAELHLDPCNNCDVRLPASREQVSLFEHALMRLGFLSPDAPTGGYGPATFEAVKEFQRSRNSAIVDGIVGPKELAFIGEQSGLYVAGP